MLQKIWHDLYYKLTGQPGEKLALSCRDASIHSDEYKNSPHFFIRFRYYLHLSLCVSCRKYNAFLSAIKLNLKQIVSSEYKATNLEKLNKNLVTKFSVKK